MISTCTARHTILGFFGALALSASLALPALAQDTTVTQQVTGGSGGLTASVTNASMSSVQYSNAAGLSSGLLFLTVNDARGTSEGWNVTIASTNFLYGGVSPSGLAIPNTGFSITLLEDPETLAGQTRDATGGPNAQISTGLGTLDAARKTISANPGFGSGEYFQEMVVYLAIPARSQLGTYTATLTVLASSAP